MNAFTAATMPRFHGPTHAAARVNFLRGERSAAGDSINVSVTISFQ